MAGRPEGFEETAHRLEAPTGSSGGLVLKKKPKSISDVEQHVFKKPQSVLGLQALAAQKRKLREEEEAEKNLSKQAKTEARQKRVDPVTTDDSSGSARFSKGRGEDGREQERDYSSRKYRSITVETPTHTGGVSDEAKLRYWSRQERERDRRVGVYATSREERNRDRETERDGRRRDRREGAMAWEESPSSRRETDWEERTPGSRLRGRYSLDCGINLFVLYFFVIRIENAISDWMGGGGLNSWAIKVGASISCTVCVRRTSQ